MSKWLKDKAEDQGNKQVRFKFLESKLHLFSLK
jgi:hypothetical protein